MKLGVEGVMIDSVPLFEVSYTLSQLSIFRNSLTASEDKRVASLTVHKGDSTKLNAPNCLDADMTVSS